MSKQLPDESDWSWMEAIPQDFADALIANVVGLLHLPDERELGDRVACLGSGFLVSVGVKHALCITAAHVLTQLRSRLPPSSRAPGFEPAVDRTLVGPADRREPVVHVERDGQSALATIAQGEGLSAFDVALPRLTSDFFEAERRPWGLAINSDFVDPGTPVLVAGRRGPWAHGRIVNGREAIETSVTLELRLGKIRAVHRPRDRAHVFSSKLHCPVYELTCPIPHGMSGSPIFIAPSSTNRRVEVIGVASFGLSSEHEDNPNESGSAYAVPIAAALVAAVQNQGGGESTMLDLVRAGTIFDSGRSWLNLRAVRDERNGEYGLTQSSDRRFDT